MYKISKSQQSFITTSLCFFLLLLNLPFLHAEGTRSLAPSTADEAALFIGAGNTGFGGGDYGQFAWKGSSSKFYFNIQNTCEKAYFGFSIPKNDRSFARINPMTGQSNLEEDLIFRIIDPNGNPINNLACFGNTIINGEAWQTLNSTTANIADRTEALNGPAQLGNAGGYNAFVLDLSNCGLTLTGNYSIEFYSTDPTYNPNTSTSGFYIPYFDVTVANCTNTGLTGRVWSNNWGLGIKRDGDGPFDRAFNGTLYVCSQEGFVTEITFNTNTNNRAEPNKNNDQKSGFRAGAFNISFNTRGPGTSGNISADRQSLPDVNAPNPQLPVFLNEPDPNFCPLQDIGKFLTAPKLLTGCPNDWCINILTTQPGQFEVLIEGQNGNGIMDQPTDRRLIYSITSADLVTNPQTPGYHYEICIPWDGKDGLGNVVSQADITISGTYAQGIYHFPVYDAEFNDDGFKVATIRPALGDQLLYFDDRLITEASNTNESKNGTNGCTGPCHRWTGEWENYSNSNDVYGNFNTINTWWFAIVDGGDLTTSISASSPLSIACPVDFFGCEGTATTPDITGQAAVSTSSNSCAYLSGYTDKILATNACNVPTHIQRKWFAYYESTPTDSVSCTQNIFLEAPTFANCPEDIFISCSGSNGTNVFWTPPTLDGLSEVDLCNASNLAVQQVAGPPPGSVFPIGTTIITYQVVGSCNTVCSFEVIVESGGTLECPADYLGCIGDNTHPNQTGYPTLIGKNGNCPYSIDYVDQVLSTNNCGTPTSIKRKWFAIKGVQPSVAEPEADSLICCQLINLTEPVFTNCPSDIIADCSASGDGSVITWTPPTVGSNAGNCSQNTQIEQIAGPAPGSVFPVGTTTVTYKIVGSCNQICSFKVTVNAGLTINCPTDYVACLGANTTPQFTGQAIVQGAGSCAYTLDYQDRIVTTDACNKPTLIERKWFAFLNSNPSDRVSCTQNIRLEVPEFTYCPSNIYLSCSPPEGSVVNWSLPTVGNSSGICTPNNVQVQQIAGPAPGSVFPIGTTTITYQIVGSCNTVCSFKVIVEGGVGITCPDNYYGCVGDNLDPQYTGRPTVTGKSANCPYTIKHTDETIETDACGQATIIRRKWVICYSNNPPSVADEPTDSSFCIQNIYLDAPTITNCPADIIRSCEDNNGQVTWTPPTISSPNGYCNLNNVQLQQVEGPAPGSIFPIGTTKVTYKLVGSCSAVCSFTVTVGQGLSVACPDDIVVDCESGVNGSVVNWELPEATTCCNDCPTDGQELPGFVYMGEYNGHQYYCSRDKKDWPSAKLHCESMGGYLAVLDDPYESTMLSAFLENQNAFIGLHDSNVEGQFEWVNGAPLTYTNWYTNQPNNYRNYQDYGQLLPNGYWNDEYNNAVSEYILEIPCLEYEQIAGLPKGSVFPEGTTTVAYSITDACGQKETCSFDVTVNDCPSFIPDYCETGGHNTNFFWIRHVVCGDINNQSVSNGGYADFTHLRTNFSAGSEQTIVCSPGYASTRYVVFWSVFIDYNGDGDFNDPHEKILSARTNKVIKAKFDIPWNCITGPTRMRVSMKYGALPGRCEFFRYGEVEDYTINLRSRSRTTANLAQSRTVRAPRITYLDEAGVSSNTALQEQAPMKVNLYPNPAQDEITVNIENSLSFTGTIRIYNNLGQIVYQDHEATMSNQVLLNIRSLTDGLYYLNIESNTGQSTVKKFLKK